MGRPSGSESGRTSEQTHHEDGDADCHNGADRGRQSQPLGEGVPSCIYEAGAEVFRESLSHRQSAGGNERYRPGGADARVRGA